MSGQRSPDPAAPRGLSRRHLLGGALAAPFLGRARASRAEFVYHYAGNLNGDHPLTQGIAAAARHILEDSDGRVEIRLYPNSQLGSELDLLTQLRAGAIELYTISGIVLGSLVPAASINGVGFAFADEAQVWRAMDGDLGTAVRDEIARRGIVPLERIWDGGFRQITSSSRPITAPGDLRGFKIRVPVSRLWTSLFTALGAAPASIGFGEVYASLQTHVVDGQETALIGVEAARLYEVQRYCALTGHMWDGFWLLANARAWERLPPGLRELVAARLNEAAVRERAEVTARNRSLRTGLASQGLRMNEVDRAAFATVLQHSGFYAEWRTRFGSALWSRLEQSVGRPLR